MMVRVFRCFGWTRSQLLDSVCKPLNCGTGLCANQCMAFRLRRSDRVLGQLIDFNAQPLDGIDDFGIICVCALRLRDIGGALG